MSRTRNHFVESLQRLLCPRRAFSPLAVLTFLAALSAAAGHVRAEDDVLKLVPEKALGFAVVNNIESADNKIQQLVQQMNLPVPIPSVLTKIEGPGGITKGLDKKRPVAVLFLSPKEGQSEPSVVVLAPVEDYAKFLEPFNSTETDAGITKIQLWGEASVVRQLGSYAAITGEPMRDALVGLKPADEVPEAVAKWQPWMAKKDAAGIVFAPGIRMTSKQVQQMVAMVKGMALANAGDQGKQAAAAMDMYAALFKTAEKEVDSCGFAVERNNRGMIRLSVRARLVSGGSWASFVSDVKPAEQNPLAGLPTGSFFMAGGGPVSEAGTARLVDWSFSMIKNMREFYGLTEEQVAEFSKLSKLKFPGIRGFSFDLGVGAGDEPIIGRMLILMRVDNSKEFLDGYEKYMAGYNKVLEKINSTVLRPIECERTEVEGIQSLKVTTAIPQMPNMPPGSEKMIEAMYGPGGKITACVVPCDEHTVLMSYAGKEHMKEMIASAKEGKSGLADDENVAKSVKMLPKSAVWRFYVSPQGMFEFGKRVMMAAMPPGANMNMPTFGETPPVALGLLTGENEVEFQTVVPTEVIKEIGRLSRTGMGGPMEQ